MGRVDKVHGPPECRGPVFLAKFFRTSGYQTLECFIATLGVLCTWVKLVTDLQILGFKSQKNAFGGGAFAGEL